MLTPWTPTKTWTMNIEYCILRRKKYESYEWMFVWQMKNCKINEFISILLSICVIAQGIHIAWRISAVNGFDAGALYCSISLSLSWMNCCWCYCFYLWIFLLSVNIKQDIVIALCIQMKCIQTEHTFNHCSNCVFE